MIRTRFAAAWRSIITRCLFVTRHRLLPPASIHCPQADDKSYLSVSTYASAAHAGGNAYGQKGSWNAHATKPKFAQPASLQALPELSVSEASPSHAGAGASSLGGGLKQLSSVNAAAGAGALGAGSMTGSFARRHYRRKKDGVALGGGGLTNLPMASGGMKKL